jgi:hypothetical protein
MERPEPKRQPDSPVEGAARLLSARFILAAQAAMQRPEGATVEELATIVGWRHGDVEGALPEYCWGWDAGARPSGTLTRLSGPAALATANERLGHPPDEKTMVRLAEEIAAAKRADSALTVQRIATTLGVPEDTVEELIAWAGGEPE